MQVLFTDMVQGGEVTLRHSARPGERAGGEDRLARVEPEQSAFDIEVVLNQVERPPLVIVAFEQVLNGRGGI